jgi:hypothetical protein
MNLPRELALKTMLVTQHTPKLDFLLAHDIATPMPIVPGALPGHACVFFPSLLTKGLPVDLMVVWTIADFPDTSICSSYYDPASPWYNVFYGAYGVLSHKANDTCWGFKPNGDPDYDEMFLIAELDYNALTAGQLGCPPEKQNFKVLTRTTGTAGSWSYAETTCTVPSGLHHVRDAINANPLYYSIFGFPDPRLVAGHSSYEPVVLRGQSFFRKAVDDKDKITIAWGALCPDTTEGNALRTRIITAMRLVYP